MLNKINHNPASRKLIVYIVLIVVTLAVFWQLNRYDFINVDDNVYVTENPHIQSGITPDGFRWAFSTFYADFWHPLTWLSFMLDYQLYGLNPGGYHLTNIILHVLSTILLFWLFNRITGAVWKSAFIAALFALHPLHVESVARISERKDVLCAFFWMLTLCLYVYYTEKPVIRRYLPVLFLFVLALMSKPMVVTLPIIMILLDYWPLSRFEVHQSNLILWQLKEKTPFFILSAVFSIITFYAQYNPSVDYLPWGSRMATAIVSFMIYLEKIFWPQNLAFCYPYLDQLTLWQVLGAASLIIIISIFIFVMVKKMPYLFVGWLWYVITLLPVIGMIHVRSVKQEIADRYTYLPLIGIGIMIAWSIPLLIENKNIRKNILFPIGIVIMIMLSFFTWHQCGYWKDSITLFSHDVQVTKDNYRAYYIRGETYLDIGRYRLAIEDFNKVIDLKPGYIVYLNRGVAYDKLGDYQNAIMDYNRAIHVQPDFVKAYYNRGVAYLKLRRYQMSIADFNRSIYLKPDFGEAYKNRGIAYLSQGNNESGCRDVQKACEWGKCKMLNEAKRKRYCH